MLRLMENTKRDYSDKLNAVSNTGQPSPANFHVPRAADNYNDVERADNYSNEDRQNNQNYLMHKLNEKRQEYTEKCKDAKQLGSEAKTLAKSVTPWGFLSLISQVHILTDMPYFFAVIAALLKDGLDLIGIGSLPAIGTAVTACSSIFIAAMMFLGNIMHTEHDRTIFQSIILKQFGVLAFTTIVELFFGLNLAPLQTVGVIFIYSFALATRKNRNEVSKKANQSGL